MTAADHDRIHHLVETIGIGWISVSALGAVLMLATASQERATGLAVVAVIGVAVVCAGRLARHRR